MCVTAGPVLTCVYNVHVCANTHAVLTCMRDVCFCMNSEELWEPQAPPAPELRQLQLSIQTEAAQHLREENSYLPL